MWSSRRRTDRVRLNDVGVVMRRWCWAMLVVSVPALVICCGNDSGDPVRNLDDAGLSDTSPDASSDGRPTADRVDGIDPRDGMVAPFGG